MAKNIFQQIKANNPYNKRLVLILVGAFIIIAIIIVLVIIIPKLQSQRRLQIDLDSGRIYTADSQLEDKAMLRDFAIPEFGGYDTDRFYPQLKEKESWSTSDIKKYWDPVDQENIKELSENNRSFMRERLEKIP